MSTGQITPTRPPASPAALRAAWRSRPGGVLVGVAVALGVLARLYSPSALWLDEALSVGIATRPVPELLSALRSDGSPPLYYLLLHAWTGLVGSEDLAVRSLSTAFSLAALPAAWLAGRRLGGAAAGRAALLLLAVSPFAVRYATEARMYALVQLLSVAGLLAVLRALERPTATRLLPVSLLAGLLALSHYWALFLLAAGAALLLLLATRGPGPARRTPAARTLAALLGGGVLFLPWLPTFLFQVRRTGTPWAPAPVLVDAWYTLTGWSGGGNGAAVVLTLLLAGLVVLALLGRRAGSAVLLSGRPDRTALALLAVSLGTVLLGLTAAVVVGAGFAVRYSSVALVPGLLLAALGIRALPPRGRATVLALASVAGLLNALPQLTDAGRTQAAVTAAAVRGSLAPGDVVAYCPDQLGPAVSRLLPAGTDQVVYPSFAPPELVDWVDYGERNAAASPSAFARELAGRTDGAVWLVSAGGYLTFGRQCEQVARVLESLRGEGVVISSRNGRYAEQQDVVRYDALADASG